MHVNNVQRVGKENKHELLKSLNEELIAQCRLIVLRELMSLNIHRWVKNHLNIYFSANNL